MCIRDRVFIGNRLYGRNAAQHFIMILAHLHHIVKGAGLDIELLANHLHFLRGIDNQVGVSHIHQMLIAVGTAVSSLTDGRRNRVGHENHPVQIVITLLYVCLLYTALGSLLGFLLGTVVKCVMCAYFCWEFVKALV